MKYNIFQLSFDCYNKKGKTIETELFSPLNVEVINSASCLSNNFSVEPAIDSPYIELLQRSVHQALGQDNLCLLLADIGTEHDHRFLAVHRLGKQPWVQ